ncbi:MAG: lysoplasmalogenase [Myxococcales bacterium]|nr:lysoplasmalogenase [Myxococcales bacterium]MBL0194123.1 lysoplasmalogenase [Myxococcales bacterium]
MPPSWLLVLVLTALVAALLAAIRAESAWGEWLTKPAASLTFIVAGLGWGGLLEGRSTPFGRVLVVGLVLAAIGDVLLIPKGRRAFLAGLVAFLLGHVAYGVAFLVRGVDPLATLVALVVVGAVAVPVLRWLWPSVKGPMRGPVAAYVVVITGMVALAAGTARRGGAGWLLVGAVMFYISDLFVARQQFVKRELRNRALGLPLYYAAQLVLASQAHLL